MDCSCLKPQQMCEYEKRKYRPDEIKASISIPEVKALSDDEIIAKLESLLIIMDEDIFTQSVDLFLSVEEMFYSYYDQKRLRFKISPEENADWLWVCLFVLWERWTPDQPSFEMIDELMQNGYYELENSNNKEACECWLKAWNLIAKILDKREFKTIDDFDSRFKGYHRVYYWIEDVKIQLEYAAREDPKYIITKNEFTREFMEKFPYDN